MHGGRVRGRAHSESVCVCVRVCVSEYVCMRESVREWGKGEAQSER